jgi:hypothetical protein
MTRAEGKAEDAACELRSRLAPDIDLIYSLGD